MPGTRGRQHIHIQEPIAVGRQPRLTPAKLRSDCFCQLCLLKAFLVACTRPLLQANLSSELRPHATQPHVTLPPRRGGAMDSKRYSPTPHPHTLPNPARQL